MLCIYRGKLTQLRTAKNKAGIFDSPQIRPLIKKPTFVNSVKEAKRKARISFVFVFLIIDILIY